MYPIEDQLRTLLRHSCLGKGPTLKELESIINQGDYLVMKVGGDVGPAGLNRFNDVILTRSKWQATENLIRFPDGGRLYIARRP